MVDKEGKETTVLGKEDVEAVVHPVRRKFSSLTYSQEELADYPDDTEYPYHAFDVMSIDYGDKSGESIIIGGYRHSANKGRLTLLNKDMEIEWTVMRYLIVHSISFNWSTGHFLVVGELPSGNDEIAEFDRSGTRVNEITSIDQGTMKEVSEARWDLRDPTHFWFVSDNRHVLIKTSWDGVTDAQFGEWGVKGSDDSHLWAPTGLAQSAPGSGGSVSSVVVCDEGNNRVIRVDPANDTITTRKPIAKPVNVEFAGHNYFISTRHKQGGRAGVLWYEGANPTPKALLPVFGDVHNIRANPKHPNRILLTDGRDAYELSLRNLPSSFQSPPRSYGLWDGASLSANTDYYSIPLYNWFSPDFVLFLKPDTTGTAYIEVARMLSDFGSWDGEWETVDDFSLSSGMNNYINNGPRGYFRVRVVLDNDGTLDGWVVFSGN